MVLATKQKRPVSIQHKKRHGQHHKVTRNYTKTYWPYLPLLLIIGLGIAANSLWTQNQKSVLGYSTDMSVSELLSGTNAQRNANGLSSLNENSELDSAAQAKANNMVQLDYWSHVTPSGQQPWVFITQAGYNYAAAGENLAYGFDTSQDVITAWMGSPEHRANILDSSYKDVGFGFANSPDFQSTGPETIVVAEYGEPASTVAAASNPSSNPAPQTTSQAAPQTTPSSPAPSTSANQPTSNSNPVTSTPVQKTVASSTQQKQSTTGQTETLQAKPISRIELLSSKSASWSTFAVSSIMVVCILVFLLRHGFMWHKLIKKSEKYAIKLHLFDVLLVVVGVIGFLLTRNAGMIH